MAKFSKIQVLMGSIRQMLATNQKIVEASSPVTDVNVLAIIISITLHCTASMAQREPSQMPQKQVLLLTEEYMNCDYHKKLGSKPTLHRTKLSQYTIPNHLPNHHPLFLLSLEQHTSPFHLHLCHHMILKSHLINYEGEDDHNSTLPLVVIKVDGIRARAISNSAADNDIISDQLLDKIVLNNPAESMEIRVNTANAVEQSLGYEVSVNISSEYGKFKQTVKMLTPANPIITMGTAEIAPQDLQSFLPSLPTRAMEEIAKVHNGNPKTIDVLLSNSFYWNVNEN